VSKNPPDLSGGEVNDDLRHRDGELVARPETPGGPLGTWLVFYYDGEPVAILDYFSGAGFVSDDTEGGTWYANADLLDEPSEAEAIA